MTEQAATETPAELAPAPENTATDTPAGELAPPVETATDTPAELAPADAPISDKAQSEINRNVKKRYDAERKLAKVEEENRNLRDAAAPAVEVGAMPTLESCDFDETVFQTKTSEYFRKVSRQEALNVATEIRGQDAQATAQAETDEQTATYVQKAADFAKDNPDYDQVFDSMMVTLQNPSVGQAILAMENGPAIAHHLGKNLDKVDKLNGMNSTQATLEIAKLGNVLSSAPQQTTTTAPDPPETVTGGGHAGLKKLSEMSMTEFMNRDKSVKYPE
ncbi:hypothetical protein KAR91_09165 [Candidatus Pacearchaeota archaeon]|nr:hypothetical protein [Candidatus Pacearchaeota archaeon]